MPHWAKTDTKANASPQNHFDLLISKLRYHILNTDDTAEISKTTDFVSLIFRNTEFC